MRGRIDAETEAARRRRAPLWAPVASGILPGSGQLAMREPHGAAYLAAEVYAWIQFAEGRRDRDRFRDEFRRLAREVARRDFGGAADGPWSYYESLTEVASSGRYNASNGPTLVPETDTATFNGQQWQKARELFFGGRDVATPTTDPRYAQAIAFYDSTAVHEGYRWSWIGQQLSWTSYKDAIARKNQATRHMNRVLGIVLANHLVSSIDALATVRVRRSVGPDGSTRYEAIVPWAPFGRPSRRIP